jgi:hypothetical protein
LNYIFHDNQLNVSCSNNLDENKIVIMFENEIALIQNRDSEKARRLLILNKRAYTLMRDTIFKNGKQVMNIPYDYGKQRLAVYYNNKFIGELSHWQTNHYHVHDYTVEIKEHKGIVVCTGKISGPDIMDPVRR